MKRLVYRRQIDHPDLSALNKIQPLYLMGCSKECHSYIQKIPQAQVLVVNRLLQSL